MTAEAIKKHWKYIKALKKGKIVEHYDSTFDKWREPKSYSFPLDQVYRIKNKHQEIIDAYDKGGVEVEFKTKDGEWMVTYYPSWIESYEYRIKTKEYIPFDFSDAEQLVGKLVKVKGGDSIYIILFCTNFDVGVGTRRESYFNLFDKCTFLDGTPCGKLKE